MFSSDATLQEFVSPVPICRQEANLATIVKAIGSSQSDKIAIVDRGYFPIGIVRCRRLMIFLLDRGYLKISSNANDIRFARSEFPTISDLNNFIEPVVSLTAQMKIGEFLLYLQSESTISEPQQHYVALDSQGKLLGLVNIPQILNCLSFHPQEKSTTPQLKIGRALSKILEQIPLPIALQTKDGQTIYQNHHWQNSIECQNDLNLLGASSLQPQSSDRASISLEWQNHHSKQTADPSELKLSRYVTAKKHHTSETRWQPQYQQQVDFQWGFRRKPKFPLADSNSHCHCLKANYHLDSLLTPAKQPPIITELPKNLEPDRDLTVVDNPTRASNHEPALDISLSLHNHANINAETAPINCQQIGSWSYIQLPLELDCHQLEAIQELIPPGFSSSSSIETAKQIPRLSKYWLILALKSWISPSPSPPENSTEAELRRLARLKDELLANIGHDLKSPLTGIIGLSSLLQQQKLGELNQRQLRYVGSIDRSSRQLMNIVNDLLDLSNLATGKLELNLESIELKPFCDRVYHQVITKLHDTATPQLDRDLERRKLQVTSESGIKWAIADRLRMSQILTHLLKNAIQFSAPDTPIGIEFKAVSNWIAITVWDRGQGIPPSKQISLLEQLFQSNYCQLDRQHRASLGLILARQLANAHGGDISFISNLDRGSQFTLLLPDLDPQLNAIEISALSKSIDRHLLVLIIETQPEIIEKLAVKLEKHGYYAVIARNETEALSKARQLKPDKILLNPKLPLVSGNKIFDLLKSDTQTRSTPLYIITDRQERAKASQKYPQAEGFICLSPEEPLDNLLECSLSQLQNLTRQTSPTLEPKSQSLTILCLDPKGGYSDGEENPDFPLKDWVHGIGLNQRHRVIEADSLEQASILAKIWHLDVMVLNGKTLAEPLQYLRSLQEFPCLAALPLITLDAETTAVANQIAGLSVFPCLVPAQCRNIEDLMQVIQIATGNDV